VNVAQQLHENSFVDVEDKDDKESKESDKEKNKKSWPVPPLLTLVWLCFSIVFGSCVVLFLPTYRFSFSGDGTKRKNFSCVE
jgi:hypothetical protein